MGFGPAAVAIISIFLSMSSSTWAILSTDFWAADDSIRAIVCWITPIFSEFWVTLQHIDSNMFLKSIVILAATLSAVASMWSLTPPGRSSARLLGVLLISSSPEFISGFFFLLLSAVPLLGSGWSGRLRFWEADLLLLLRGEVASDRLVGGELSRFSDDEDVSRAAIGSCSLSKTGSGMISSGEIFFLFTFSFLFFSLPVFRRPLQPLRKHFSASPFFIFKRSWQVRTLSLLLSLVGPIWPLSWLFC